MGFDQNIEYKLVDSLIDNNIRFALYRLPSENEIHLIVQNSSAQIFFANLSELNNQEGFVIAPFRISETSPITLIKADITISGDKAIFQFIDNLTSSDPKKVDAQSLETETSNSFKSYKIAFDKFLSALSNGDCQKLVLSRTFEQARTSDFSPGVSFKYACEKYPNDFIYLAHTDQTGVWLGCSPELLVSGEENRWQTVALAGTKDELNDEDWDEKNRIEQQIVADYMLHQLQNDSESISQKGPFTAHAGNLKHLKTEFTFQIKHPNRIGNLLELLHPSPAVCGFPKQETFDFITQNEGYDRQYYSGFLGCLNMDGKTDLFVNLRCMKINEDSLRLYAGGGLLPSSDLEAEWNETESKLQTILTIIND